MASIEETLLTNAKTDKRFHAAEQQTYLGTLLERVLLKITFDELNNQEKKEKLLAIFPQISELPDINPLYLKISHNVNIKDQILFMKLSEKFGITSTVMSDSMAQSSYALIFHTDHETKLDDYHKSLQFYLSKYQTSLITKEEPKKNIFKRFFHLN